MKKFIFMMLIMVMGFVSANAQTAIQTPKLLDNTYVGVFGGASTPLSFSHTFPLNGQFGLTLGKNWSPIIGTEVQSGVVFGGNGFDVVGNGYTAVRAINTGVNVTFNLTNAILGYNPNKVFEVQTVTGIGWLHLYSSNAAKSDKASVVANDDDEFTAKTGVRLSWNLGKNKAWAVYAEPSILWNLTNGVGNDTYYDAVHFNSHDAQLSLNVGVVYKFKTSNGTHNFKLYNVGAMNDKINTMQKQLAEKPKVVEKTVEKTVGNGQTKWVVFFGQGSSTLDNDAKKVLDEISNGTTVEVVGHASEEGSVAFNQKLSESRANAVAEYLTNRGVKVNSTTGEGETGTPKNRVVIITDDK